MYMDLFVSVLEFREYSVLYIQVMLPIIMLCMFEHVLYVVASGLYCFM